MAEFGRDIWRLSGLTSAQAAFPGPHPDNLERSPRRETPQPGATYVSASSPAHKEVLPGVQKERPVCRFVPMASCPVIGHH